MQSGLTPSESVAALDTSTPVLLLGGKDNSLAITRNLSRQGIDVRVSGLASSCWALFSRYCKEAFPVPQGRAVKEYWAELLLPKSGKSPLAGSILLPCNDDAVELIADLNEELRQHYILDDSLPQLQRDMLNKRTTLEHADRLDVKYPKYWDVSSVNDVDRLRGEITFPVIVKPVHSHKFLQALDCKLFIIKDDFDELREKAALAFHHNLEIQVVELIEGPDSRLLSYSTYIDADGEPLYHFTKRMIRRYPSGFGNGALHITEWLPDVAEMGQKYLNGINFRGPATIEFKHAPDDTLRLIEVNHRITAPHELYVRSGMPIDVLIYRHLTGQRLPLQVEYKKNIGLLSPIQDFLGFLQLRRRGELTFIGWLRSITQCRMYFPVMSIRDPWPMIRSTLSHLDRVKELLMSKPTRPAPLKGATAHD